MFRVYLGFRVWGWGSGFNRVIVTQTTVFAHAFSKAKVDPQTLFQLDRLVHVCESNCFWVSSCQHMCICIYIYNYVYTSGGT